MPHCELVLYERFLRANWASGTLHHVLLVGNDLREYATTYDSVFHPSQTASHALQTSLSRAGTEVSVHTRPG
jgi:hypothetical protein